MLSQLRIGPIRGNELPEAVRIFLDAFHANVGQVYGEEPKPDAMLDVWAFARDYEPRGFVAARDAAGLVGYALFTSSVKRLQREAVLRGRPLVWGLRAITGRYGIRWLQLARLFWNKLLFVGSSGRFRTAGDAQLLNIAVDPRARGKGVAKALMRAGLDYLANNKIKEVRLEVRPDNAPALAVYRAVGFVEKGRTRDMHGEWLVLTAVPSQAVSPYEKDACELSR